MKAEFKVINPDNVPCEMTISMNLAEWKKVKECLGSWSSHSSFELRNAIGELVSKAEKEFTSTGTTE